MVCGRSGVDEVVEAEEMDGEARRWRPVRTVEVTRRDAGGEREWREADMWVPHTSGATQASLARHVGLMGGVCTRLDLHDTRDKFGCPKMHFGSSGT